MRRATLLAAPCLAAPCLAALCLAGCIPADDRPEPGSLYVTVEPGEAITQGFTTSDGWTITYQAFLTAVGDIDIRDDPALEDRARDAEEACVDYSETHYDWLFDFTAAPGQSKVGLVYGLGRCSVEFRIRAPSDDGVLGRGATPSDVSFMRTPGSDDHALDERVAVLVRGHASRDGVIERFEWQFRRAYEIRECLTKSGDPLDGLGSIVTMEGGGALTMNISMRGEELFRQGPFDDAPLYFDAFAAADADGNGDITLAELGQVPMPAIDPSLIPPELAGLPLFVRPDGMPPTLGDLVYELMLPRIARFSGGGACNFEVRESRR